MNPIWIIVATGVLSAMLVGVVRRLALKSGVVDTPNHRSSHVAPTPRGAGLGLLVAIIVALVLADTAQWLTVAGSLALLGVALVAAIGWKDDRGGVPPRARLTVHLLAALLVLPLASTVPWAIGPAAVGVAWWILWVVSSVNVVNFMDGTDGIIGIQAAIFGLHIVLSGASDSHALVFGAVVLGASLGFLVWNWNPAKIFLGDVGSGAVGILMVVGGILLMARAQMSLVGAFLPLAPIFLDASVTLVARARRGARLSDAHREHVYQVLANGGWGHQRIALAYGAAAMVGVVVSYLWPRAGALTLIVFLAGLAALGGLALRLGSTRPTAAP